MNARNRRALWVLGLWVVCLSLWVFGRAWWTRRNELRTCRVTLGALSAKEAWLREEFTRTQGKRKALLSASRPAWLGLPEDQLHLRFQDALLSAAQKAGLQEVRLKAVSPTDSVPLWRIEAVGSLAQWMDFVEGVVKEGVPLDLRTLHWAVNGDPWNPLGGDGAGSLLLRGETEWSGLAPRTISETP